MKPILVLKDHSLVKHSSTRESIVEDVDYNSESDKQDNNKCIDPKTCVNPMEDYLLDTSCKHAHLTKK